MKKIKLIVLFFALILVLTTKKDIVKASGNLDEIQKYNINVNLRDDGSLDMYYKISWRVLDSSSEGPLEWVKIGIPNKNINEIKAKSDNIKNIRYYSDGGEYVRIDLDKAYYAGDIVDFEFSFHQEYMYRINEDEKIVAYNFTPGWFDDIEVKNLTIRWNKENVIKSNSNTYDDGYYVWQKSLKEGERYTVELEYNLNDYSFDTDKQSKDSDSGLAILVIVVIIVIVIIIAISIVSNDDYDGGFGRGGTRYRSTYIHSSSRSSGSRSSGRSCACACACASGGRAGCNLKDFYGTKLKRNKLKEVIEKNK